MDTNPHPEQDKLQDGDEMGMEGAGRHVGGEGVGSAGALLQDSSEEPYPIASSHKWVPSEYAFLSHYCKITLWFYL